MDLLGRAEEAGLHSVPPADEPDPSQGPIGGVPRDRVEDVRLEAERAARPIGLDAVAEDEDVPEDGVRDVGQLGHHDDVASLLRPSAPAKKSISRAC